MKNCTIYHNPRCSKSRQALALLKEKGIEPKIVEYLKDVPSAKEIEGLIKASGEDLQSFLRKKEEEYGQVKSEDLSTTKAVAQAIHKYPKLLQRPIVCCGKKAVIARSEGWEKKL